MCVWAVSATRCPPAGSDTLQKVIASEAIHLLSKIQIRLKVCPRGCRQVLLSAAVPAFLVGWPGLGRRELRRAIEPILTIEEVLEWITWESCEERTDHEAEIRKSLTPTLLIVSKVARGTRRVPTFIRHLERPFHQYVTLAAALRQPNPNQRARSTRLRPSRERAVDLLREHTAMRRFASTRRSISVRDYVPNLAQHTSACARQAFHRVDVICE